MRNMTLKRNSSDVKFANLQFFTKYNAAENTSFKKLHSLLNFLSFYYIICKWIIKKVKINLDIIFSEITFDYSEVKR